MKAPAMYPEADVHSRENRAGNEQNQVAILVTLFTCILALAGYRLRTGHVTASVPAGTHPAVQNREDLRKFMQARIHQEYTFLSFTVWHDRPLDAQKMENIAQSSAHVVDMSRELTAYAAHL